MSVLLLTTAKVKRTGFRNILNVIPRVVTGGFLGFLWPPFTCFLQGQ